MPRVALTAAQKEAYILDRRAQWLANGLAAYRNKEHLSIKQFGRMVGLSDKTISRLLKADREVTKRRRKAPGFIHGDISHKQYLR